MRLIGLSQTDSLTTLMNRRGFQASVSRILDIASGALNRHVLVMLDADDFKLINDTYGHMHGDQVLSRIAEHMRRTFRITDLLGRLGGDEFAAFLVNFQDEGVIRKKIEELLARLQEDGLSCRIGIAIFTEHENTFQQLYQSADIAPLSGQEQRKNGYRNRSQRSAMTISERLGGSAPLRPVVTAAAAAAKTQGFASVIFRQSDRRFPSRFLEVVSSAPDYRIAAPTVSTIGLSTAGRGRRERALRTPMQPILSLGKDDMSDPEVHKIV